MQFRLFFFHFLLWCYNLWNVTEIWCAVLFVDLVTTQRAYFVVYGDVGLMLGNVEGCGAIYEGCSVIWETLL